MNNYADSWQPLKKVAFSWQVDYKLSSGLVKESQFDCFCFEDLNLKGMSKLWGRKVSDLSYYAF